MDGADTDDLIYMVLNYITIYLSVRIKMYEYKLLLAIKIFFPVLKKKKKKKRFHKLYVIAISSGNVSIKV